MTEPTEDVEEIDVPVVPEPEEPVEGVIDPADTYAEGVDAQGRHASS